MYTIMAQRNYTSFNGSVIRNTTKEAGTALTRDGLKKLLKTLRESLSRQGFKEETTVSGTRMYLYVNRLGDKTIITYKIREKI